MRNISTSALKNRWIADGVLAYSLNMIQTLPGQSEMKRATFGRDVSYDGVFFVCVKTTRIFCRPSCPARKPLARNMTYHASVRDCLLDGFRPCKRCRPLATGGDAPEWLSALVERVERAPAERLTDTDLRTMNVNPHRARRYFTQHFGMTFQGYHRARRMGLALAELQRGRDPLSVAFDHGFDSQSGFRDAFERTFGTTPGKSSDVESIQTTRLESPVGPLVAAATSEGVCLLEFADRRALQTQVASLRKRLGRVIVPGTNRHLDRLATELDGYFSGTLREFTVPLVTPGTDFQKKVWDELLRIPYGKTRSYEQMARNIIRPGAQRAVGRANGDNRIAIIIPCHRVIRSDGTLCGYGGGLWRKQFLLDHERNVLQRNSGR